MRPKPPAQKFLKNLLTNNLLFVIISSSNEREIIEMSYEEALEILIQLMIENQDVLLRLKEGEEKENEENV